jgi:hypothetical protein
MDVRGGVAMTMLQAVKLLKYDAARHALSEAHRVDEAKDIRDKALAVAAYARQAQDRQLILHATEIKLRAERRTGELLRETEESGQRQKRGGDRKSTSSRADIDSRPSLKSLGITADQSSDWQKLAAIPEPEFEQRLKDASGDPALMTTARILNPPPPIKPNPFEDEIRVWAGVSAWLARSADLPDVEVLRSVRPKGGLRSALRVNFAKAEEYMDALKHLHEEDWL